MKEKLNEYGVSQSTLYAVCDAAWNLCSKYLPQFTAFKAIYTDAYVSANLQAIEDAKDLPEAKTTIANRKAARIRLINATATLMSDWQQLKIYIIAAFDKSLVPAMLDAAGKDYYAKSSADGWSSLRNIIKMANTFIEAHETELIAKDNNMPLDFPATFQADGEECLRLYKAFFDSNMDKQEAVSIKLEANNNLYASTVKMLKDGHHIFSNNEIVKKFFTFSHLVSMNVGEGTASVSGYVYNAGNQPLQGVTISIKNQEKAAVTSRKGYFRLTRLSEGSITLVASLPGYSPVEQQITLAKGTRSTITFELTNIMKKVA